MARVDQTVGEILAHLREQIGFLRAAAARFDAGDPSEAKLLSTFLRTLLHRGVGKPLLGQITELNRMSFLDSAGEVIPLYMNVAPSHRLTEVKINTEGATYVAVLGELIVARAGPLPAELEGIFAAGEERFRAEHGRRLSHSGDWQPFDLWWTIPVIRDAQGNEISRRDLVLSVADMDGGTHVDPAIEEVYARLSRSNSLAWVFQNDKGAQSLGNPVPASIRQIAWEVDESIKRQFPELAPA